jgi:DNA-binding response OmpR family regulator
MDQPTVMLVEADILVRHPLAEYLRECGYRVIEAADTAEARLLLNEGQPVVDAILADIAGGREPDFGFANWVRTKHPAAELVLAGTMERAVDKAGDLCEQGPALIKPYDHAFVADRIRKLLAERQAKPSDRA